MSVKQGGRQIEYEDQDPRIHRKLLEAIARTAWTSQMGDVFDEPAIMSLDMKKYTGVIKTPASNRAGDLSGEITQNTAFLRGIRLAGIRPDPHSRQFHRSKSNPGCEGGPEILQTAASTRTRCVPGPRSLTHWKDRTEGLVIFHRLKVVPLRAG